MTTATPPARVGQPLPPRPTAPPQGGGGPAISIDFIRLLRQYKYVLAGAAVVGVTLGAAAHMVLMRLAPKYQASVLYTVLPPQAGLIERNPNAGELGELDRFAQTQARTMVSDRILREAIRQPKVRNETTWAKKFITPDGNVDVVEAWKDLRENVSSRVVTTTNLVQLSVSAAVPADASVLANEIHDAYFKELGQIVNVSSREQREALERRANQIRTELARIEGRQNTLLQDNKITSNNPDINVEADKLRNLEPEIVRLQQTLDLLRTDLQRMEGQLQAEGVPQYGADMREVVENDPVIQGFKQTIAEYKTRIDALLAGRLGPDHRDVVNLREMMAAKENELNNLRERKLRESFDATIANTRNGIDRVRAQIEELTNQRETAVRRREEITRVMAEYASLQNQKDEFSREQAEVRAALANILSMDLMGGTQRVGRMRLLETASTPEVPSFPRLSVMLPAGLVLTLGLVAGFLLVRELLDTRIKSPSDIALLRGIRLLGMVPAAEDDPARPAAPETAYRDAPTGAIAEAFRQLRPGLLKRMHHANHKSLLVVGASPSSGASTIAANLAVSFAAADHRVLLVDANLRRPSLHKTFKLGEGPGLGNILARNGTLEGCIQQTGVEHLHLLAAGNAQYRSSPERLGTELMTQILREAGEKYDLIIVDTAPALVAGDGLALASRCDASLLVARALAEKRGLVARMAHQLGEARAESFGVIVNAVRASAGGYLRNNMRAAFEYQNSGAAS
jgi:succinoglycan biosynthesis transport protein ExoP